MGDSSYRRHGLHNRAFCGERKMPWKACKPMDERLKFVARRLDGEKMAGLCREFGISRKRIRTSDLCLRRQKLALLCAARPSVAGISEAGPGRVRMQHAHAADRAARFAAE